MAQKTVENDRIGTFKSSGLLRAVGKKRFRLSDKLYYRSLYCEQAVAWSSGLFALSYISLQYRCQILLCGSDRLDVELLDKKIKDVRRDECRKRRT